MLQVPLGAIGGAAVANGRAGVHPLPHGLQFGAGDNQWCAGKGFPHKCGVQAARGEFRVQRDRPAAVLEV